MTLDKQSIISPSQSKPIYATLNHQNHLPFQSNTSYTILLIPASSLTTPVPPLKLDLFPTPSKFMNMITESTKQRPFLDGNSDYAGVLRAPHGPLRLSETDPSALLIRHSWQQMPPHRLASGSLRYAGVSHCPALQLSCNRDGTRGSVSGFMQW
ncbi:hypothetical protein CDAR_563201 [Caerostris darwini]|uniref:Uncharacterized protein n=1 Tax=Caerostris darwini TaxID=1538125 RepID=A0AAV4UVE4_9ARAC|nr:hypothetical protein CDAR_563201 [Caerostris darwini]